MRRLTAALFKVINDWKQPKCLSIGDWLKILSIYIRKYSVFKKNKVDLL